MRPERELRNRVATAVTLSHSLSLATGLCDHTPGLSYNQKQAWEMGFNWLRKSLLRLIH